MKKILTSLATIALTAGSFANSALWANKVQQKSNQNNQNVNKQTKNEDAEDIANKLWNKTVKIDPNVFLNKNLHTDKEQVNAAIVKQGILTQDEAQYVSWGSLQINVAGWYWNKGAFSVSKDGATATGHVTVDADSGETPAQIVAKLEKRDPTLNFNYWNGKNLQTNLVELRSILVNEGIVTKVEASEITGIADGGYGFVIDKTWINLGFPVNYIVNDNNTSDTAGDAKVEAVNDGDSAQQIANSMQNKSYGLKTNAVGQYADDAYITQDFDNLLQYTYGFKADDLKDVSFPHVKLQTDNLNINASITKDGQTATAKVDLECKNSPYIYYHYYSFPDNANDLAFYVNLTPAMTNTLKGIFSHYNAQYDLGVFYNALDDGELHGFSMPSYSGPSYIPWTNRLVPNLNGFGSLAEIALNIIAEATNDLPAIHNFANVLYQKVMHSDGYLSIMCHWHYTTGDQNTISDYHFW